jgi:hypothetical protein
MTAIYNHFQYRGDVPQIAGVGATDKNSIFVWLEIFQIQQWRSVVNIYPYMDESVIDETTFVRVWNRAANRATGSEPKASQNIALPIIGVTGILGLFTTAVLLIVIL